MLGKRRRLHDQDPTVAGPNYAILKLRPDTDCVLLFQHALSLGISDISFVSHPREFFTACSSEPTSLQPSRTPETPHDEPTQGTSYQPETGQHISSNSASPIDIVNNPKNELRSPSADSSIEADSEQVNQVLATLFGKNDGSLPISCPDDNPVIPSNGTTVCKICGAAVSCRKITNLSLHVLRSHCAVPLWRCPTVGCEFSHADSGKIRNHLRSQHGGDDSMPPLDNRTVEMLDCARLSLSKCFPTVDWSDKYQNVFYLTDPPTIIKEEKKPPADPWTLWDRIVIRENNVNQPVRCNGCQLMVPLNKKAIEEHIRIIHKPERPFQCGVCEYASPEEWKVRLHMTVKHADRPFAQMRTCSSWNRPHLYLKKYFPEISDILPVDDFEVLLDGFKPATAPMVRELPGIPAPPTLLPVTPTVLPEPANLTDATVESLLLQMFPAIRNGTPLSATHAHRKPANGSMRVDRLGGKVECSLCMAQVEAKRTMLVSHCKSHCPQRQWQCPHCETSAAFHSKLKLHIVNAHKSDAEPLDHYTPELENKWLLLFRQCFPQFAQQCYQEDWKFRSKQQQHYGNHMDDSWNRSLEGTEQPKRSILIEGETALIEANVDVKPPLESKLA